MRSRGLVVVLAFLLAAGATAAVFLYVRGVREEAQTGGTLTTVVVSTQAIPASTDLNTLIDQEVFTELQIPTDAVVVGAITNLEQLRDKTASSPILAGEQIPAARLGGQLPGGDYGIAEGYQAVTLRLPAQQVVGSPVRGGQHVTVYAAFDGANSKTLKRAVGGDKAQPAPAVSGVVFALVPYVKVLDVIRPGVAPGAQAGDADALVTLELLPRDGEKIVFAQKYGTVWLALLPPDAKTPAVPPVDFLELVGKK